VGDGRLVLDVGVDVRADRLVAGHLLGGGARQIDLRHQGGVLEVRLRHSHQERLCRTGCSTVSAVMPGW
jgi:hypothetical protein